MSYIKLLSRYLEELYAMMVSPVRSYNISTLQMQFESIYTAMGRLEAEMTQLSKRDIEKTALTTKQALVIRRQEAYIYKLAAQLRYNEEDLLYYQYLIKQFEQETNSTSLTKCTILYRKANSYVTEHGGKNTMVFESFCCQNKCYESKRYAQLLYAGHDLVIAAHDQNIVCLLAGTKRSDLITIVRADGKTILCLYDDSALHESVFVAAGADISCVDCSKVHCRSLFCLVRTVMCVYVHYLCERVYLDKKCEIQGVPLGVVEIL